MIDDYARVLDDAQRGRAIELARDGIEFSGTESRYSEGQKKRFNAAGLRHFYRSPEQHYRPGDLLRQPASDLSR